MAICLLCLARKFVNYADVWAAISRWEPNRYPERTVLFAPLRTITTWTVASVIVASHLDFELPNIRFLSGLSGFQETCPVSGWQVKPDAICPVFNKIKFTNYQQWIDIFKKFNFTTNNLLKIVQAVLSIPINDVFPERVFSKETEWKLNWSKLNYLP